MFHNATKDKAQSYTLESIAVFTLLISVLILAQALYSVEAISQNITENKIEVKNGNTAESIILSQQTQGNISKSLRTWDESDNEFYNTTSEQYYTETLPQTEFGSTIEELQENGYNVNIDLIYYVGTTRYTQEYITTGQPDENGATYTTNVPLYNSDPIRTQSNPSETSLSESSNFIIQEDSNDTIYNTVTVQIHVWKI